MKISPTITALSLLLTLVLTGTAQGASQPQEVQIADPFIELHSGPGRGYPVFYVIERGQWVTVIRQRTEWFKIEAANGKSGWVPLDQLTRTLTHDGSPTRVQILELGDFSRRRGEAGALSGSLNGAQVMTLYGGYAFSPNVSAELSFSQALGNLSTNYLVNANLVHQAFPDWRYSPFFALGAGNIKTKPRTTLILGKDRSDLIAHVSFGIRTYISRQFAIRGEYNKYVVFSSDDNNEDLNEWKLGLITFF